MPGTSPQGAPANREHASSRVRTTNPEGFSASEATLATSLFGPMPTEEPSPVARCISPRIRSISSTGAGTSLSSR